MAWGDELKHKYIQEYLSLITKTHTHTDIQTQEKSFIFIFLITTQEKAQKKKKNEVRCVWKKALRKVKNTQAKEERNLCGKN